jgi:hypothetical protein
MPFQKGLSGNPSGRRIEVEQAEVRALAREYTAEAVARLAEIMRSSDARASAAASIALLDRGWGRPGMSLEVSNRQILPCEEREALFREVMRLSTIPN